MNVKYTIKNNFDELVYCIVREDGDLQEEFEKVLSVKKGHGFSVECYEDMIKLVDYFAGETRAVFKIVNKEKSNEELLYFFKRV